MERDGRRGRRAAVPGRPWTSAAACRAGWRIHGLQHGTATHPGAGRRAGPGPGRGQRGRRADHPRAVGRRARQAARTATRLDRGERMLLAAGASLGFLRWYLGAFRAGVVVIMPGTPPPSWAPRRQLGARLAVADPGPAQRLAELRLAGLGWAGRDGQAGPGLAAPKASLGGLAEMCWPRTGPRKPPPSRSAPCLPWRSTALAYTSGTTGRPKGVPLTHGSSPRPSGRHGRLAVDRPATCWYAAAPVPSARPGPLARALVAGSTAHLRSRFDLIASSTAGTVL